MLQIIKEKYCATFYLSVAFIVIYRVIITAVLTYFTIHLPGRSFSACDLHGATLGGNVIK
jgi:hypothetical protein